MSELILTLRDIRARLTELQRKYDCSNEEFRNNPAVRERVSDEDDFEWEAYLAHEDALAKQEEELHREYLSRSISASREVKDKYKVAEQLAA